MFVNADKMTTCCPVPIVLKAHDGWVRENVYTVPVRFFFAFPKMIQQVPVFTCTPWTMDQLSSLKQWWTEHCNALEKVSTRQKSEAMVRKIEKLIQMEGHPSDNIVLEVHIRNIVPLAIRESVQVTDQHS